MKAAKIFFYLFLLSVPFGARILVFDFAPAAGEYGRAFLYLSDALLVLFLLYNFKFLILNFKSIFKSSISQSLLIIFLIFSGISVFLADSAGLAAYNLVRLLLLAFAALATAQFLKIGIVKIESMLAVLAGSAVFQSLLGIWQFLKQGSIGFFRLGEAMIGPEIPGVAKIIVDGEKIVRAYGTFPHPNVLAAFLLLGLFSLYYLFLRSKPPSIFRLRKTDGSCEDPKLTKCTSRLIFLALGIFVVLLGLLLSFSRTSWLIAAVGSLVTVIYPLFKKDRCRRGAHLAILLTSAVVVLALFFQPYFFARFFVTTDEPAVVLRSTYNKLALEQIRKNPLGAGIGNQVLYSVQNGVYQKFGLTESWQFQPIHNIYLLIASEAGIISLVLFVVFLITLFLNPKSQIPNPKQITNSNDQNSKPAIHNSLFVIPKVMLAALLLFGLVDHFLWTSQSGQLMLWLVVGILLSSARSSTDRTYPSEG